MPPSAQTRKVVMKGKLLHQPTMISPGSTKMIAERVPPAEATVWTMLFSRMLPVLNARRIPIEMTAAGIEDAMVMPTRSPR